MPLPPKLWLWVNHDGRITCGNIACTRRPVGDDWILADPIELAELAALAAARGERVRCTCGALEYHPAAQAVRETEVATSLVTNHQHPVDNPVERTP